MTVTKDGKNKCLAWTKYWGLERNFEIDRMPDGTFGFTIVSGQVEIQLSSNTSLENVQGIFIKNVDNKFSTKSNDQIKPGDCIVEINGTNLRNSSCEKVVELLKTAGNQIKLTVQSFNTEEKLIENSMGEVRVKKPINTDNDKENLSELNNKKTELSENTVENSNSQSKYEAGDESDESSDSEDERYLEGNVLIKSGIEISRRSAGNVKRSTAEIAADPEKEDEFGYTLQKIKKKYGNLGNDVFLVQLEKNSRTTGIALAGHKDRNNMNVFICGLNPSGIAAKNTDLKVGDEILEVNGMVFQGRSHLNASVIIQGLTGNILKMVIYRNNAWDDKLAVKPISQFPTTFDDMDQFSQYENARRVTVKKGQYGIGIMIVAGKHAEVGQGIFISDIQEGSVAEQAGLHVGEMILGINSENLVGSTQEHATTLLKQLQGVIALVVCNPNQTKKNLTPETQSSTGPTENKTSTPAKSSIEVKKSEITPKTPVKQSEEKTSTDSKSNSASTPAVKPPESTTKTIEIVIPENGFGVTITGGSDTLSGGIFILDIYPNAPDTVKNDLKCGDQILEFATENFRSIDNETARNTLLSAKGNVKMIILREENMEIIETELQKKPAKGIGLSVCGLKGIKGAFVSDMFVGGSAIESGKVAINDRIIAINGENVQESTAEDIAILMKIAPSTALKLGRYKSKQNVK